MGQRKQVGILNHKKSIEEIWSMVKKFVNKLETELRLIDNNQLENILNELAPDPVKKKLKQKPNIYDYKISHYVLNVGELTLRIRTIYARHLYQKANSK